MKLPRHHGRSGTHGAYPHRHNDRRFDVENSEHIDAERARQNVNWDCYRGFTTHEFRENPEQPPMFCMLLRKHLQGARILELNQPPLERILEFRLETLDELGDRVERRLVLEAMGRSAGLLLLDGEGRVLACIRRVDGDLGGGQRQLLPGLFYRQPPEPDKLNPFTIEPEELRLELGCGKGGFMAQKAVANPDINFLAVDIKSDILGLTKRNIEAAFAQQERPVDNVRIFAYEIERILQVLSKEDVVDRIYINFCNPWPKKKQSKKRLTYPRQLFSYQEN